MNSKQTRAFNSRVQTTLRGNSNTHVSNASKSPIALREAKSPEEANSRMSSKSPA